MAIRDLKDKVVFITGAASGIGAATAHAFAAQDAVLVLADLDQAGLARMKRALVPSGATVHIVSLDVADEGEYAEVAHDIKRKVGVPHVLINNAGIGVFGSFLNTPMDAVRRAIDINLYGVYNGCHAFLPMMLEAGGARHLVNVASLASIAPMPNMSAYAASKYAVDGLTEVLAMELENTEVEVSCIHPGVINTPIAGGKSYNGEAGRDQERRLGEYYKASGSDPAVVATAIVEAVHKNRAHVYVGAAAPSTSLLKRISPALTRSLSIKSAKKVGFA